MVISGAEFFAICLCDPEFFAICLCDAKFFCRCLRFNREMPLLSERNELAEVQTWTVISGVICMHHIETLLHAMDRSELPDDPHWELVAKLFSLDLAGEHFYDELWQVVWRYNLFGMWYSDNRFELQRGHIDLISKTVNLIFHMAIASSRAHVAKDFATWLIEAVAVIVSDAEHRNIEELSPSVLWSLFENDMNNFFKNLQARTDRGDIDTAFTSKFFTSCRQMKSWKSWWFGVDGKGWPATRALVHLLFVGVGHVWRTVSEKHALQFSVATTDTTMTSTGPVEMFEHVERLFRDLENSDDALVMAGMAWFATLGGDASTCLEELRQSGQDQDETVRPLDVRFEGEIQLDEIQSKFGPDWRGMCNTIQIAVHRIRMESCVDEVVNTTRLHRSCRYLIPCDSTVADILFIVAPVELLPHNHGLVNWLQRVGCMFVNIVPDQVQNAALEMFGVGERGGCFPSLMWAVPGIKLESILAFILGVYD